MKREVLTVLSAIFVTILLASCRSNSAQDCTAIEAQNRALIQEVVKLRQDKITLNANLLEAQKALREGVCPFACKTKEKAEATASQGFEPVGGGFSSRKVSFSSMSGGYSKYRGEMRNGTGRTFGQAFFMLAAYDDSGSIADTDTIIISNFATGDVRVFDGMLSVSPKKIAKSKIQFQGGD